jgi:membrane-associated phospholipid phosphatase
MPSFLELPGRFWSDLRGLPEVPGRMTRGDWLRFSAGATAVGLLAVYDEDIRDRALKQADPFWHDFKPLGEYTNVTAGFLAVYGTGRLFGNRSVAETGCAGIEALALTAVPTLLTQGVTGRKRPEDGGGYNWFSFSDGHGASGHAAVAFATVTVIDRRYMQVIEDMTPSGRLLRHAGRILLYGAATGTAIERINADKHFASDVAIGGAFGFLCANYVMNRRTPDIGIRADGNTVSITLAAEF